MGFGMDEDWEEERESAFNYGMWTEQSGKMISVRDMTTAHIKRVVRRIATNQFRDTWLDEHGEEWMQVLSNELKLRGSL